MIVLPNNTIVSNDKKYFIQLPTGENVTDEVAEALQQYFSSAPIQTITQSFSGIDAETGGATSWTDYDLDFDDVSRINRLFFPNENVTIGVGGSAVSLGPVDSSHEDSSIQVIFSEEKKLRLRVIKYLNTIVSKTLTIMGYPS